MTEKNLKEDIAGLKELLLRNMIEIHSIVQLLIENEIFTWEGYFEKLKQVQAEFKQKNTLH